MKMRALNWALNQYRNYKRKRHDESPENLENSLKMLLSKCKYLFLSTHNNTGQISSRYVQPIVEWDAHTFKIWIGTSTPSRKITEIRDNPLVTLSVGHENDGANIIIYGRSTLHTDDSLKQKFWKPEWKLFFPNGPGASDSTLICVEPEHIELVDFKRNIFPEPFGLQSLALRQVEGRWLAQPG
ncbi:hypothetical protein AB833_24745 [Chromatiales bacterium (ex Bugula neritina AB1)]|nr:hypothetical protein AB833_24745 [Chromatiales bacterium (ex Bugula neritina AB1)]